MNTEVQVPEGMTLLTRDTFLIPKDWVAIWHNPNKTRQWMFWVPEYRSIYWEPEAPKLREDVIDSIELLTRPNDAKKMIAEGLRIELAKTHDTIMVAIWEKCEHHNILMHPSVIPTVLDALIEVCESDNPIESEKR